MLGRLDLDPLPLPEDVVLTIPRGAICAFFTAVSPVTPFANCRNWAGLWNRWQAGWTALLNLLLATVTALDATKLGLLGDDGLARHGTIWAWMALSWAVLASLRAVGPRTPFTLARNRATILRIPRVARLLHYFTALVRALVSAMLSLCDDLVDPFCMARVTWCGAIGFWSPFAHAINWTWRSAAIILHCCAISCRAAFTTTYLLLCNGEGLCLLASTTACLAITTITHKLELAITTIFALAPFAPGTFTLFWATRQWTRPFLIRKAFVFAATRRGLLRDGEAARLRACLCAFFVTEWVRSSAKAIGPVLKAALAIRHACFCATLVDLLRAAFRWAVFAAMLGFPGDGVRTLLHSTTTGCSAIVERAPTPFTINWAPYIFVASL